MTPIWAGIDAGRTHRHCVVIDGTGKQLLSPRVANDETELLNLLADVLDLDDEAVWGIDLADGGAARPDPPRRLRTPGLAGCGLRRRSR